MERVLKRDDLARLLAKKTGFYISNTTAMLKALDEIIVENMSTATKTEPSEIYLSLGFIIGGRYVPKRKVKDPRNGKTVTSPAKYIPYAKFKTSFRNKINKKRDDEDE